MSVLIMHMIVNTWNDNWELVTHILCMSETWILVCNRPIVKFGISEKLPLDWQNQVHTVYAYSNKNISQGMYLNHLHLGICTLP